MMLLIMINMAIKLVRKDIENDIKFHLGNKDITNRSNKNMLPLLISDF